MRGVRRFAWIGRDFKASWVDTDESRRIRHEVFHLGQSWPLTPAQRRGARVGRDDGIAVSAQGRIPASVSGLYQAAGTGR
jgi:hypothetical protein